MKVTGTVVTFTGAVVTFTVDISNLHSACNFPILTVKVMIAPLKVITATVTFVTITRGWGVVEHV